MIEFEQAGSSFGVQATVGTVMLDYLQFCKGYYPDTRANEYEQTIYALRFIQSHGKVKRLLEMLFEIHISRSTSCRSMLRTAGRLEYADAQVRKAVRGSPQVVGDETGWRVDARGAWLHAFLSLTATSYEVDTTRSIGPAKRLLGIDWSGIFGHDGWAIYDKFTLATHQQCLAHHLLRRCNSLIENGTGGALAFPRGVKDLLLQGFEFRNRFRRDEMTCHGMKVMAGRLTMQVVTRTNSRHPHLRLVIAVRFDLLMGNPIRAENLN